MEGDALNKRDIACLRRTKILDLAEKQASENKKTQLSGKKDSKKYSWVGQKIKKSKVLLFKRIMSSSEKEDNQWMSVGTQYLGSALKKEGAKLVFSDSKISFKEKEFITDLKKTEKILKENPDINFIAITLAETYFDKARELIKFLRKKTKAFIGVGGIMPTLSPRQVFVHLPEADFLVRGAGEEIFPKILKILDGSNRDSVLTDNQLKGLSSLKGFIFSSKENLILASVDEINKIDNYDKSALDFFLLEKEDVLEGLNLFTSWGCHNNCFFCTSWVKGCYAGKSFSGLKKIVYAYYARLKELFKNEQIPISAFKLSFNDDDFLGDPKRAADFFDFIKKSPFYINFFQTGINSFFVRKKGKLTDKLNKELLGKLTPDLFYPRYLKKAEDRHKNHVCIYIGTENYSDAELKRLGKGYDFGKIQLVVKELSERQIYQAHHFIASNSLTGLEDIVDNLFKISGLRKANGDYFGVLTPIISHLVSFCSSVSYRAAILKGRSNFLNIKEKLLVKGYPQYDYSLVENDIPMNKAVRNFIPVLADLFLKEKNYREILDKSLAYFSKKEALSKKEIISLIKIYKKNYE